MNTLLQVISSSVDLDEAFDEDTPLLSSGLIDSFDLVNLLSALEEFYGVEIPVEDIDVATFDTPRQMAQWLEGLRS